MMYAGLSGVAAATSPGCMGHSPAHLGHGLGARENESALHVIARGLHVAHVAAERTVVVAVLPAVRFTFEVVVARRAVLVPVGLAAALDHFLHPHLLGGGGGLHRAEIVLAQVVDARGDVIAL